MKEPTKEQLNSVEWWKREAPEWATHYVVSHQGYGSGWYELKGGGGYKMFRNSKEYEFPIDNYRKDWPEIYERPKPQPTDAKPESQEWVDGLPPVGCECEVQTAGIDSGHWQPVKVIVYSHGKVWLQKVGGEVCVDDWVTSVESVVFRPLKTDAEQKRDERNELLVRALEIFERGGLLGLYDAGMLRKGGE